MPLEADAKKELEEAIKGASSGTLVQGTQRVYGVLQKHGLLRRQVVQPGLVGCHRENRDGFGLSVKDVSELTTAIKEVGFDHGAINAVAVELSPDDELTFQFNEKLARDSGYMLPSIPRHQLKFASLAGSHTNAALRLIAAGAEHTDGDLCVRGRLALEQVRQVDAEFARAVDEGVSWRIISLQAMEPFPELGPLIQAAANSSGQLARVNMNCKSCTGWPTRLMPVRLQANQLIGPLSKPSSFGQGQLARLQPRGCFASSSGTVQVPPACSRGQSPTLRFTQCQAGSSEPTFSRTCRLTQSRRRPTSASCSVTLSFA